MRRCVHQRANATANARTRPVNATERRLDLENLSTPSSPSRRRNDRNEAGKAAADGDGAKSNAQGKPTGDGDEESAREEEMVDGEDLDHRHRDDDEAVEGERATPIERMLELLKTFTPSQMERYECYRRSNLSKPMLRRLFKAATSGGRQPERFDH